MGFVSNLPLLVAGPLIILLLISFAVGGLTLFRRFQLPKLRFGHGDSDFSAGMIASIMVFYGLALALTAVHLWEMHQDVRKVTTNESGLLASLWRNVSEYPEPTRSLLQAGLKDYVDYTIHEAWPMQRKGIVPVLGLKRIDRFETTLMQFEPKTEGQKLLMGQALLTYNQMIEVRRERLDAVELHLPGVMWVVVLAGAAISLISSFYFPVEDFRVHAAQVALLATLIGVVITMIVALDRPYHGEMGLTAAPYELVYEQLMR
jgi:fumarate reductase subunit D